MKTQQATVVGTGGHRTLRVCTVGGAAPHHLQAASVSVPEPCLGSVAQEGRWESLGKSAMPTQVRGKGFPSPRYPAASEGHPPLSPPLSNEEMPMANTAIAAWWEQMEVTPIFLPDTQKKYFWCAADFSN